MGLILEDQIRPLRSSLMSGILVLPDVEYNLIEICRILTGLSSNGFNCKVCLCNYPSFLSINSKTKSLSLCDKGSMRGNLL